MHEHGLLALTVPKALGGGGASLPQARKAISAIAKGEPSTALILVMQYLQHTRLQDGKTWPRHLRVRVAEEAVRNGALINALRVEPDLGTPARGGLPATTAVEQLMTRPIRRVQITFAAISTRMEAKDALNGEYPFSIIAISVTNGMMN